MLSADSKKMDATDLRAWIFETHTLCNDFEACNELDINVKSSFEFAQSVLYSEGIDLRMTIFNNERFGPKHYKEVKLSVEIMY